MKIDFFLPGGFSVVPNVHSLFTLPAWLLYTLHVHLINTCLVAVYITCPFNKYLLGCCIHYLSIAVYITCPFNK